MKIGDKIKKRRLELGMTVDELAAKLGKNRSTVYRYENKEIGSFPTDMLQPLVIALQVSPDYFMDWEDLPDSLDKTQEILDFLNENPDVKVAFTTLSNADLTPEQKNLVVETMVTQITALKKFNEQK